MNTKPKSTLTGQQHRLEAYATLKTDMRDSLHSEQFIRQCLGVLIAGLISVANWNSIANSFGQTIGASLSNQPERRYPSSTMVVDVTKPPYNAKGNGTHDDTQALQQALDDTMGKHQLLYLPSGIYLVSKTLQWSKKNSDGGDAWGFNFLCGQDVNRTVIRLKNATFTNLKQPASIMWCGGFGSADWFHNYVENLTFDVGDDNPTAIGLQFYSNNSGAVRNCRFVAGESSGLIGLDLGHRDMNGPLLVHNCEVVGFERGISAAGAVNGLTLEHITLRNQRRFGIDNEGQSLSVRSLLSQSSSPAFRSYGSLCLIEAKLEGNPGSDRWPAIINYNGGRVFARDIDTSGYSRAIGDVASPDWFATTRLSGDDKPGSLGPKVTEYCSQQASQAFPASTTSLRLPIMHMPQFEPDPVEHWANVDDFGADPSGKKDSSEAIEKAMNSGAFTVFMPGSYAIKSTVTVGPKVQRVIGIGGSIDYHSQAKPDFRVPDGNSPTILFEHFSNIHGGIEINTNRTVCFRSVSDCDLVFGSKGQNGDLYFEDFVTHNLFLQQHRVWARQLNVENEGTHIVNNGGQLWILGYKTERGGTLLDTRQDGKSEVLGGFSYTTTAGGLAPMFVIDNASLFTFFSEVCYNGDPFVTLIQQTNGRETKSLKKGDAHTVPFSAKP
ncbi:MAG: glycosyl hydrolase family 28-related protein [Pirellulales bacterium]